MKVDVLQNSKDVYTVYMDIMGGTSRAASIGIDGEPPEGSFPNTFVGLNQLKEAFPGCEFNIIGAFTENNKKTTNAPSDEEINSYLSSQDGFVQPMKKFRPPETTPTDCSTLLLVFEQKVNEYKKSTRKKKELAKAYCNGFGRAIKMIYPEVEFRLKEIIEGTKEEKDLL